MPRIPMPTDLESADHTLGKFMDNALKIYYKDSFSKAVSLKFGPFFVIKVDMSSRMYFHCTVCNKDMNNVRALNEHSYSGTHNKNKDIENESKFKESSKKFYHRSTLQSKIQNSDTTFPILGLQRVEAYDNGNGSYYYKCLLCGAHGKVDSMYGHLIGEKHTDKYIRSRIVLRNPAISNEERMLLRRRIFDKEKFSIDYIKTIKGAEYYPWKWEKERRTSSKLKQAKREEEWKSSSPAHEEKIIDIKVKEENKVVLPKPKDKAIQAYSHGFLNSILMKFNLIVQAHRVKDTDLRCPKDLKVALNILRYTLHLLFHTFEKEHSDSWNNVNDMRNAIRSCLGYVMVRLIPHFESHYEKL